jgi:N-acetylglucosaminyldiphosphoundecaprenol N-acetyl-beta-D-mannosaminyltransferase
MRTQKMLGITIPKDTKSEVLEKIQKNITNPVDYFHIASLNPEIIVLSQKHAQFKEYLNWAQIRILDGTGVLMASRILGYGGGERITGVDLMEEMLFLANEMGLRVGLIGGKGKVAERVVNCQKERFPRIDFIELQGFLDISKPSSEEEQRMISIVLDRKPHMIFVAFGSPFQELWLYKHRDRLKGIICMGVGGAFDFLSGNVPRAPYIMRKLGFEWLFRLIRQPWRLKRQLRIIAFIRLVVFEAIHSFLSHES